MALIYGEAGGDEQVSGVTRGCGKDANVADVISIDDPSGDKTR